MGGRARVHACGCLCACLGGGGGGGAMSDDKSVINIACFGVDVFCCCCFFVLNLNTTERTHARMAHLRKGALRPPLLLLLL